MEQVVGTLITTALGMMLTPDEPRMPELDKPKPMPQMDDEEVRAARRKAMLRLATRGGRQSTFLSSNDTDALGA